MKDDNGKPFTLVHDRFEVVCPQCCGRVSGHSSGISAIEAAEKHSCIQVDVFDLMSRKGISPLIWRRDAINGARTIDLFLRKLGGTNWPPAHSGNSA